MDRTPATKHTPAWWTDRHTLNWNLVKAALERDWEQTKHDLSKDDGLQLNQNVADTVRQSVGSKPIPPIGAPTRPASPKTARKARKNMERESVKAAGIVSKAHEDIAQEHFLLGERLREARKDLERQPGSTRQQRADAQDKASDRIALAQDQAFKGIAGGFAKIEEAGARRAEAIAKWSDAEQEVRYGYSVRSQYPAGHPWDEALEKKLETEWDALLTDMPWSAARQGVRRGWDYASKAL